MKEFEKIKELILKKDNSIKSMEFGEKIVDKVNFSVKYSIIINGELMDFGLTPELIQDIKFSSYMYHHDVDVEEEISSLIVDEYKQFRESRR